MKLKPTDASFLDEAPVRLRSTFDIPLPAFQVWAELTSDDPLHWCRLIRRIEWTSPRPFGVGTTRSAHLAPWPARVDERFFRWEEGRRKSFSILSAIPAAPYSRLAEDYLVDPTSESSCTFTWTIALKPMLPPRLAYPVFKRLLGTLFTDTRRHFSAA